MAIVLSGPWPRSNTMYCEGTTKWSAPMRVIPLSTPPANGNYTVNLTATNLGGTTVLPKVGYINVSRAAAPFGVGVYRPSAHMFYQKNGMAVSWTTMAINWGTSTDLPVTGKWR